MKVLVLFGGMSTEYSVSCVSASYVLNNIKGHDVVSFGITEDGKWFKTDAKSEDIASGKWVDLEANKPVFTDLSTGSFIYGDERYRPDVVFPVLHGKNGEDGTVQGLLELMSLKYVGCRVLGSSVCMDKAYTKIVLAHVGIAQTDWVTLNREDYVSDPESVLNNAVSSLKFPVFVKPSNAGSSIGITRVDSASALKDAVDYAFDFDRRVVIENGVEDPLEIEVAVMGNDDPIASVSGLIIPSNTFYDFDAKYKNSESKLRIPSGFEREDEIRKLAVKAYKACDCKGLSRVDFLVSKAGQIFLNEINTIPGFTSISMYPKLFAATGVPYDELINRLLDLAVAF